jgi:hypothetical protein
MHKSAVILDIVEAGKMGTIGISHHHLLSDDGDQGWESVTKASKAAARARSKKAAERRKSKESTKK